MKKKEIIHCDLKPENIMFIDENYKDIKLIDFGSSYGNHKLAIDHIPEFTLWYRAPEIALKLPGFTNKIDMWALGCIFYELITKKALFNLLYKNPHDLLVQITLTLGEIP